MAVPEVNRKLLSELEAMGFPLSQATRALHYSGNSSLEAAIGWVFNHEDDPEINEMPLVPMTIEIEASEPSNTREEIKLKAQELRDRARRRKEEEEKKLEREREKKRIRSGKELLEAKRVEEENERNRSVKSAMLPGKSATKAELMSECLRSLRRNHKDDDTKVKRAFRTLLVLVGNVARNPDEEKYRMIRLSNPVFQDRVGGFEEGIEFLELCGFERVQGGKFLHLPRDKIELTVIKSAGAVLQSAITNPFFGLLSK